jgi:fumarate hydratase subunit alpha
MPITYERVKSASMKLYETTLKKVPEDIKYALRKAAEAETNDTPTEILKFMLKSAEAAERTGNLICQDVGIPAFFVRVGNMVTLKTDLKYAITKGFEEAVKTIEPKILGLITNPLTQERGYSGERVPIISFDMVHNADYIEITCAPKGSGSGQWADLQVFGLVGRDVIEKYIMECVLRAGSQPCPPVIIGVGIGGSFEYAAKLAKEATLRRIGTRNPNPTIAKMEENLLKAVNMTGIGPMGLGGNTTALAVNIETSAGHAFIPVAVCFSCWPGRRMRAKLYEDGRVEYYE